MYRKIIPFVVVMAVLFMSCKHEAEHTASEETVVTEVEESLFAILV